MQKLVHKVTSMKLRADWGTTILDHKLTEEEKIGIEAMQSALNKHNKPKKE